MRLVQVWDENKSEWCKVNQSSGEILERAESQFPDIPVYERGKVEEEENENP